VSLAIIHTAQEGIEILALNGHLTFGPEDLDFRQELAWLLEVGKLRVVLNITHLSKLDSTGLGTLLFARDELRKAGGNLSLFTTNLTNIELPAEAQLETTLNVHLTEQDAVNSFFPDREVKRYDILEFVESEVQPLAAPGTDDR
jgi:anti-sigma B factor antagonist